MDKLVYRYGVEFVPNTRVHDSALDATMRWLCAMPNMAETALTYTAPPTMKVNNIQMLDCEFNFACSACNLVSYYFYPVIGITMVIRVVPCFTTMTL